MVFRVLGSGSSGNCYIFTAADGSALVLEAGIRFSEVLKATDYKVANIVGCIVSHRHGDHAKFVDDFLQRGIRVLALDDVFHSINSRYKVLGKEILPSHGYRIGDFKVYVFSVCHDVPCVGFIISHKEMGKTLFVTDTMMLEYRFNGINHMLLEANYDDETLDYNILNGITPAAMKQRLLGSHMEFGTTKAILMANDLTNVSEIVLVHLSSRNGNGKRYVEEVTKLCGKPTYIAKKGLQLDFNLMPY